MVPFCVLGKREKVSHVTASWVWGRREKVSHVTTSWVWVRGEKVSHVTASCVWGQATHTKQAKGNLKAIRVFSLSIVFVFAFYGLLATLFCFGGMGKVSHVTAS